MNRTPVSSSNLQAVGYDPATRTLEIEFLNGGLYSYSGVPASVHASLMAASSTVRTSTPTSRRVAIHTQSSVESPIVTILLATMFHPPQSGRAVSSVSEVQGKR